ncbi:hypothetical protein [Lactobacillus sp. A27]|uniref:hypothetical protein n=1 Tax=Lactobacillus sp. A27 TaxID=2796363 RepID=UPI00191F45D9|nr:hypothetical protein [Lactobacillus sp. A27]MBL1059523.1 hypothetical protein [Lactobacillus sp. A27]
MSTIRDPAYITNAGRTMMTAGGEVTYTKAVLYGQDISGLSDSQIKALTSLGNPLREVKIGVSDKQSSDSGSTVILEAVFQNSDLKADLEYKAVGFFARKNDVEQLVIVAVANQGAYLAATNPDGVATDALDLKIAVKIGDATSVTAVVDPAGSVTPATLNSAINNLNHDITAKIDANQDSTAKALDTKADKTAVADQLATKANQSDLDKTNAEVVKKADSADVTAQLDTKADKTDVANSVKQLQAGIDSKADKSVVDAEIAKIDFTPYAKTVDVDSKLSGYTSTADLTKLLNAKANTVDVYSRSELDKKLLEMSADTDGKVNADQVANMIAGKADKTAVDAELAKKDDITDVDAKINSNVTKLNQAINTKANASDVYTKPQIDIAFGQRDTKIGNNTNVINTINEALKSLIPDDTHAPALPAGFDLNNYFVGWRRSVNTTLKNMPFGWLNDTMYFQGTVAGSDGRFELALYIGDGSNTNPKIAYRFYGWGNWKPWVLLADNGDISNLQNQITNATNLANQASQKVDSTLANSFVRKQGMNANGDLVEIRGNAVKQANGGYIFDIWSSDWTASKLKDVLGQLPSKANSSDVSADISNLQSQINSKTSGTIITAYDIASKNPTKETNSYTNKWLVDQNVLSQFADAINSINSTRVPLVNGSGDDDLFAFKTNQIRLYPGNGKNCKNLPPASNTQWFTVQYVFENPNGDGVAIFRSPANEVWMVGNNGGSYTTGWTRLANSGDISNLQNIINQQNQTIQSLTSRLTNAENEINYIKANYVEGRTFPASQEAQANSWENENPQRIAFITK